MMRGEAELTRKCGRTAVVTIVPSGVSPADRVRICRGFADKMLGLMFRGSLSENEGALLVYSRPSIGMTSIHMLFVPFPIGVFWLDDRGTVVDRVRALPWRPFYASAVPACYVLELHPKALEQLQVGDRVAFHEKTSRS
jgi:uncharacterized membrane protein (UPF0127 family)